MKNSGFKPNPKMSGKGDMGGDGRKHKRIEKTKYADGGMVATVKKAKDIKIGKGRPLGEVTNKLPKFERAGKGSIVGKVENLPAKIGKVGATMGRKLLGKVTNKPSKFADGGTVTDSGKKNIKIGKGRLLGEVTNKPPKFVGLKPAPRELNNGTISASRELYLGGSKDFDESTGMRRGRPGGVTKIGIGGGAVGNETRTGRIGGGGGTYNEPPRRNPPALGLGKLPKGGISGGPTRLPPGMKAPMMKKKGGMAKGRKGC